MFSIPKNAVYKRISRRKFLELGGGAASALGVGGLTLGPCARLYDSGPGVDHHPQPRSGCILR